MSSVDSPEKDKSTDTDNWSVEDPDESQYNFTNEKGVWQPKPEDILSLFEKLASGEPLPLKWQCPGRRAPKTKAEIAEEAEAAKEAAQNVEVEERDEKPVAPEVSAFDFDEFSSDGNSKLTPKRAPGGGFGRTPRTERRRARMDNIMDSLRRQHLQEREARRARGPTNTPKARLLNMGSPNASGQKSTPTPAPSSSPSPSTSITTTLVPSSAVTASGSLTTTASIRTLATSEQLPTVASNIMSVKNIPTDDQSSIANSQATPASLAFNNQTPKTTSAVSELSSTNEGNPVAAPAKASEMETDCEAASKDLVAFTENLNLVTSETLGSAVTTLSTSISVSTTSLIATHSNFSMPPVSSVPSFTSITTSSAQVDSNPKVTVDPIEAVAQGLSPLKASSSAKPELVVTPSVTQSKVSSTLQSSNTTTSKSVSIKTTSHCGTVSNPAVIQPSNNAASTTSTEHVEQKPIIPPVSASASEEKLPNSTSDITASTLISETSSFTITSDQKPNTVPVGPAISETDTTIASVTVPITLPPASSSTVPHSTETAAPPPEVSSSITTFESSIASSADLSTTAPQDSAGNNLSLPESVTVASIQPTTAITSTTVSQLSENNPQSSTLVAKAPTSEPAAS